MNYKVFGKILFLGFILILHSCERDFKQIQKSSRIEFVPTTEGENFVVKHTDSARIKYILKSPLVYDYTDLEFPFTEFPKGIDLTIFDSNARQSFITADYAISFKKSDIIDLQRNVKITSVNGDILETDQLYFDQKRDWIFTEKNCKLSNANGEYYFKGFDSKSDLTKFEARGLRGSGVFDEESN